MYQHADEDSATITFVLNCYLSNAISTEELQEWVVVLMGTHDLHPQYAAELFNFNAPRFHIYKAIGFVPSRKFTKQEKEAIYGIAYLRKRDVYDAPSKSKALASLEKSNSVLSEFRATFPFLQAME